MLQIGRNLLAKSFEVARVMACDHRIQKIHPVSNSRQRQVDLVATFGMLVLDRRAGKRVAQSLEQNLDFLFHVVSSSCKCATARLCPRQA